MAASASPWCCRCFPKHMRATLTGAFMAGGMFGSVLGMALGGAVAAHMGWRWAFAAMALFGLVLALLYPIIVREKRIAPPRAGRMPPRPRSRAGREVPLRSLVNSRSVVGAYIGSGLQLFVGGTVIVWIPELPQSLLRDGDRRRRRACRP